MRKIKFQPGKQGAFCLAALLIAALPLFPAAAALGAGDDPDHEPSARELYNDGTKKLAEGKLNEAESYLQSAVATQDEHIQPTALYNLGNTRFLEGLKDLTNAPASDPLDRQSGQASQDGSAALHAIDNALAGEDLDAMVAAYRRGRGARRELKSAITAVQRAMDAYGLVLNKWRRASGDFHSTVELRASDTNAQSNADLTDRCIAKLVDALQQMMPQQNGMQQQRDELRKKMDQLKGRMPADKGPPLLGDDGDDDDDSNTPPKQPQLGDQEGPVKNGSQPQMTAEEALRLLGQLKLDQGNKLYRYPDFSKEATKPRDPKGRDW